MNGIFSIDFTSQTPVCSSGVAFIGSKYCDYEQEYEAWAISGYGLDPYIIKGHMSFNLNLPELFGVTLVLNTCSAAYRGVIDCPLKVFVNNQELITNFEDPSQYFELNSWFIPATFLSKGNNTIKLEVGGASNLFIKSASFMKVEMQSQLQTQWCWAALTSSISKYFSAESTWTQCLLANNEFEVQTCCTDGSSAVCNQPYFLQNSLATSGNLVSQSSGSKSVEEIVAQIDQGRPMAVRIEWPNGSGHFVIITGVSVDRLMISVEDPFYGNSYMTLDSFINSYQGNGKWDYTYLVHAKEAQ